MKKLFLLDILRPLKLIKCFDRKSLVFKESINVVFDETNAAPSREICHYDDDADIDDLTKGMSLEGKDHEKTHVTENPIIDPLLEDLQRQERNHKTFSRP